MQFLIPISSSSDFFPSSDFFFPKPLVEVSGKPMVELVVSELITQFPLASFVFVIDEADAVHHSLDKSLQLLTNGKCTVIQRKGNTSGALCSCLLAVDSLDLSEELCVTNFDQLIETPLYNHIESFRDSSSDAGIITFKSVHPRWSYALGSESGFEVMQTCEKSVISDNAIAGFYYFKIASAFLEASRSVVYNDQNTNGCFYISSTLNEIILSGGSVKFSPIDSSLYHSFYSPSKIEEYEKYLISRRTRPSSPVVNVVIPAAGQGSRFAKAGWKKPKPFIDLNNTSMIESVVSNVTPLNSKVTLLFRSEHRPYIPQKLSENPVVNIVNVPSLTEGTASTVLMARRYYDSSEPLLVANSDQLVDFSVDDFVNDCLSRGLDGSILVFKDQLMDPKWSFVSVDENNMVTEVAEKRAISDIATVGIYLFTRGSDFVSSALDMILANDRVNNEFYTCPVYNYMIASGKKIGIYFIDQPSMHGLGTPDDFNSYVSEMNYPMSADSP